MISRCNNRVEGCLCLKLFFIFFNQFFFGKKKEAVLRLLPNQTTSIKEMYETPL